ncbi:MAG: class I SAM-dependent methyltransferase [Xenococcaceae cyanobacterium MO_207.B15]|nr:class I SAM-dependent methyltransferase [Xenococcaceae cyanobacterium MO_207.B15]
MDILNKLRKKIHRSVDGLDERLHKKSQDQELSFIATRSFELESVDEAAKFFDWHEKPIIEMSNYATKPHQLHHINSRRLKDALILATAARNINASAILEIGTSEGATTLLLAENAPQAKVITVNIPPEEITEGGVLTTHALTKDKIGWMYKEKGLINVELILQNTITWNPNLPKLDMAFIDGCHDTDVVISDTLKILPFMKPGSYIFWHDFNPCLMHKFLWIYSVCRAINALYKDQVLSQPIFFVKNSFTGIYKVP